MNKMDITLPIGDVLHLTRIVDQGWNPQREPSSPTGPDELTCSPCGHSWADHDDDGCLYELCLCWLPGERK